MSYGYLLDSVARYSLSAKTVECIRARGHPSALSSHLGTNDTIFFSPWKSHRIDCPVTARETRTKMVWRPHFWVGSFAIFVDSITQMGEIHRSPCLQTLSDLCAKKSPLFWCYEPHIFHKTGSFSLSSFPPKSPRFHSRFPHQYPFLSILTSSSRLCSPTRNVPTQPQPDNRKRKIAHLKKK